MNFVNNFNFLTSIHHVKLQVLMILVTCNLDSKFLLYSYCAIFRHLLMKIIKNQRFYMFYLQWSDESLCIVSVHWNHSLASFQLNSFARLNKMMSRGRQRLPLCQEIIIWIVCRSLVSEILNFGSGMDPRNSRFWYLDRFCQIKVCYTKVSYMKDFNINELRHKLFRIVMSSTNLSQIISCCEWFLPYQTWSDKTYLNIKNGSFRDPYYSQI